MLDSLRKKKLLQQLGVNKVDKSQISDTQDQNADVIKSASQGMKSKSPKMVDSLEEQKESPKFEASEDEAAEDKKKRMLSKLFPVKMGK